MLGGKANKYSAVPADDDAHLDDIAGEEQRIDAVADAAASSPGGGATARAGALPAASSSAADAETGKGGENGTAATAPAAPAAAATAPAAAAAASGTPYPAIAFWILMSCSVILFNKYLYNGLFPYPLSLTCIHMLFVSCSTWALRLLGYIDSPTFGWPIWMRNVLPIGILYALSLATSNLGAARLTVSFVQMIKALTPLVALGVSVMLHVEKKDRRQAVIVGVMCAGVIVASYGEILWDTVGVFFQVTSVAAEGSRLVVTQILLQQHLPKSNPLVSMSIFAPPCFALLLPVALAFEPGAFAHVAEPSVGIVILLNTLTAFVLNLAVVILVQKGSGLILTLAGIVKDIALIVASIFIFANPVTPIQVVGYTLALLGLNMYNLYKSNKDTPMTMRELVRASVTNKQALFVVIGALVLFAMSAQSLVAYRDASAADAAAAGGSGGDEASGAGAVQSPEDEANAAAAATGATMLVRQLLAMPAY